MTLGWVKTFIRIVKCPWGNVIPEEFHRYDLLSVFTVEMSWIATLHVRVLPSFTAWCEWNSPVKVPPLMTIFLAFGNMMGKFPLPGILGTVAKGGIR
jgi:hypothetical protein